MAVYIPGAFGGFAMGAMCSHAIGKAKEWAEDIEKAEAVKSSEFASASGYFIWRPHVLIFTATPMFDRRAELLEQQGHKVFGRRVPNELP